MTWPRPVPLLGDTTTASDRARRPDGWAFSAAARDALAAVVDARRDVRRFRPDDVPEEVLRRLLAAAHRAPSVGHSQPWRFVVVRADETRTRAALLADRARLAQAEEMDPDSARGLLDLQLEGIREAPVGIVVCCDRRVGPSGVLGRATFPDADLWSCACAIQNLWLTARAEGLGVGWVTFFEPADLAELLDLPDGVVTLGWLCVGWPDERPPEPGLVRAGWSERLGLDDVVCAERWPTTDGARPAPPRSRLRAPDQRAVVGVRDDADRSLTTTGSLGVLDGAVDRILALPGDPFGEGTLVLVGADHPVTRHRVSAYSSSVTSDVMGAAVAGDAMGAVAAAGAGMAIVVVDAGVGARPVRGALDLRPPGPRGDLVATDALTGADVEFLVDAGVDLGREVGGRSGLVALGEVGIGNTTIAAALTAGLLDLVGSDVVGLGAGADTAMLDRKRLVVDRALERAVEDHPDLRSDPLMVLRALGGPEIAVLVGVALGAARSGAPIVLDGLATSVAALVATRLDPAVAAHLVAGHRSREAAHAAVLAALGLEPLLDLRIRAGEGAAACLATGLIKDALAIRRDIARTAPTPRPSSGAPGPPHPTDDRTDG